MATAEDAVVLGVTGEALRIAAVKAQNRIMFRSYKCVSALKQNAFAYSWLAALIGVERGQVDVFHNFSTPTLLRADLAFSKIIL